MSNFKLENKTDKRINLFVWDSNDSPPIGDWIVILWSSFGNADEPNVISIPKLVEEQADALRSRYLGFVYELGETHIKEKKLIDYLELRPGFSYWWMNAMSQKFNTSGTSVIDDAIKLLALEGFISDHGICSVTLTSGNRSMAKSLQSLCTNINLNFQFNYNRTTDKHIDIIREIYRKLPYRIQSLIFLLHYLKNKISFRSKKQRIFPMPDAKICFIDVLVHLDKRTFTTGVFTSNYWTHLVRLLSDNSVKTNWLHNYYKHKEISSLDQAERILHRFNESDSQRHFLIESNLSIEVLKSALKDYFRLNKAMFHLSSIRKDFCIKGSVIDMWPLFKNEWNESLSGASAIMNCIRLSLFEKMLSCIPTQKLGIYIQENQHWEMALIYAWKANGHGKLIGVPHTTVRYWDLRYFYDPRSYERYGKNDLPIPDLVAVNGPVAKSTYLQGGYPESQIAEAEALRYFHLLKSNPLITELKPQRKSLSVLICGDFLASTNYKMLSWLAIAAQSMPPETSYILKPHPAYPVNLTDFLFLNLKVTDSPLAELFTECDIIFTSNIASASVDAYCSGTPIVQIQDGKNLNTSPLRGLNGVVYASNPAELLVALLNATSLERVKPETYFFLDEELPRWRKLLNINRTVTNEKLVIG